MYASRGGYKLEGALKSFGINVKGKRAADIGCSTGGFTDCLLKNGAVKVYAIDVGYGILAWKLRKDERVVVMERKNARYLKTEDLGERVELVTADVAFISLKKIIPVLPRILKENGEALCLIKPQFEVKRREVGPKGVVKDPLLHRRVIDEISGTAEDTGFKVKGVVESSLEGPKGNKEFFIYLNL
jgi:23S rRNA (cytidine1920-2'-O)/16S rRNA (cytidine1409-2'-O)-methyltransferase